MDDNRRKKKSSPLGWVIVVLVFLMAQGGGDAALGILGMLVVLAVFAAPFLIIFAIIRSARKRSAGSAARSSRAPVFDDCPKPICFHRDKGEHHVRKGREIDPWDRPDIDISKYQRRK